MISVRSLRWAAAGLAALLTPLAPLPASAQCLDADAASRFRLELDWERVTEPGDAPSESAELFPLAPLPDATELECLLAAALGEDALLIRETPESLVQRASSAQPEPEPWSTEPSRASWLRRFTIYVRTAGVWDSNIDHDDDPLESWGAVLGAGVVYETDDVEVHYEVASHSYTHQSASNQWSRITQRVEAEIEQDISDKVEFEVVGEMALKGSSDDRDLGDEATLQPRLNFELTEKKSLRLYGAYRQRGYGDVDPTRDADNHYYGLEFQQQLGPGELDLGYRWEENRSEGLRNRYDRQTYEAEYTAYGLGGRLRELALELKVRPQNYWYRFVDNEEDEGLREDIRWIFSADTVFGLTPHIALHPAYRYEKRTSNDPEEFWDAHLVTLGLRYTFGKNRSVIREPEL